jgi:hypothetical protein
MSHTIQHWKRSDGEKGMKAVMGEILGVLGVMKEMR